MPASRQSLIAAATAEWSHWGRSTWNLVTHQIGIVHSDDEPAFARYAIDTYCAVVGDTPSASAVAGDDYAWSAVGMSFFMKASGFDRSEFPFSNRHADYIRHFVAARKNGDQSAAYWGFRLGEPGGEPEVGDLVGYGRGEGMTAEKAQKLFDRVGSYQSHTDVVVAKRSGEIDVIGANVRDSVTCKTLRLGANGHIQDGEHFWFVTLKARFD